MDKTLIIKYSDYKNSIRQLLEGLEFKNKLNKIKKIVIKPNLLQDSPPPCTTDAGCVDALISNILALKSNTEIVVIEGSGGCDTEVAYEKLGYNELKKKYSIKLLNTDSVKLARLSDKSALAYKEIFLPEILLDCFFITVPSLKDHSIAGVTLGLKNQVGLLPKKYYGGYWSYNRSDVHRTGIDKAVTDLNNYIKTDLVIIDGRLGQTGSHLPGGRVCAPAKNIIIGGYDILDADKTGAEILGHKWQDINHITMFEKYGRAKKTE